MYRFFFAFFFHRIEYLGRFFFFFYFGCWVYIRSWTGGWGGATRRAHVKNKVAEECVFFLEFFFLPGPFFFFFTW